MSITDTIKEKAAGVTEAISEKITKKKDDTETPEKTGAMAKYMADLPTPPEVGDLVDGIIIGFGRGSIYLDLPPFGTGIIYGREYINARDIIKNSNIGDMITAKVVDVENEDGYVELSLKEARQALIWSDAESAIKNKTLLELQVKEANKGGLIIEWQGISGFLPASQLSGEHYPRVEDGDKDKILSELRQLVGQKISVLMINADPKEGKLIFSEKGIVDTDKTEMVEKYSVGDDAECEVTGIVDFGVFLKIEEGLEGLAHISELDWGLVEDPKLLVKVGEKVKARIIEIKDGKISLSIKALKPNPWENIEKKYKKDDIVDGVVIKFNKYGALVSIEEGIAGLAHVSEFGDEAKLKEALELGKTYKFKISLFEPKEHKMTLTHQAE
ncbi:S1 RNA-binding domain-containing protein [Patescibacteria group bacterium]